jgi:hypothetical protein
MPCWTKRVSNTGSPRAKKYWNALKTKIIAEGFKELSQNIGQLEMEASEVRNILLMLQTQKRF